MAEYHVMDPNLRPLPFKERFCQPIEHEVLSSSTTTTITTSEEVLPDDSKKRKIHSSLVDDDDDHIDEDLPSSKKTKQQPDEISSRTVTLGKINLELNNYVQLGGINYNLVIVKPLKKTDIEDQQARLSLPKDQLLAPGFLTQEEENLLCSYVTEGSKKKKMKMDVKVIGPKRQCYDLKLSKWYYEDKKKSSTMKKKKKTTRNDKGNKNFDTNTIAKTPTWSYALVHGWNKFKKDNGLVEGDIIQVWSFRFADGQLRFAIPSVTCSL